MISWHTDLNNPPLDCTQLEWEWLTYQASLTEKLQQMSGHTTHLHLLKAEWGQVNSEESRLLLPENKSTSPIWIREIIHLHQQQVWIWGRTLIPAETLQKTGLDAQTTQPIGHILFQDPNLKRNHFAFSRISEGHPYFPSIHPYLQQTQSLPWGRRSVITYHQYPVLIIEVFLPNFFDYLLPN